MVISDYTKPPTLDAQQITTRSQMLVAVDYQVFLIYVDSFFMILYLSNEAEKRTAYPTTNTEAQEKG